MPSFTDLLLPLGSLCALEIPPGKHCFVYLFEFNFANISDSVFIVRSQVGACGLGAAAKPI